MKMKALILAAGLGSRLHEKTQNCPKALIPVAGRPILSYQMEALLENGVRDIAVVVGHCGEQIVDYLQRNFHGVTSDIIWNREYTETNSAYSFWLARNSMVDCPYLHLNCDVIFSASLLRKVIDSPHPNLLAVRTNVPLGGRLEHVALEGDRVVEMSITRTLRSVGKAFGLAKLGPRSTRFLVRLVENYLERGDKNQNYYGMIREAIGTVDYYAILADDELLLEVNTLDDLKRAEETLCSYPRRQR